MPNNSTEQAYPHLPLLREDASAERRKRPAPPTPPPARGGRSAFAPRLNYAVQRIIQERQARPSPIAGIQPHLVFRIPFANEASSETIIENLQRQTGLEIVSIEPDNAIIVFRDTLDLQEFQRSIKAYRKGPRKGINRRTGKPYQTTPADFLEYLEPEQMRLWRKEDRIGSRLRTRIRGDGSGIVASERYVVEVELWHPGGLNRAGNLLNEIRTLVTTNLRDGEKVYDTYLGQTIILAKIDIQGDKLVQLLEMDIVAEVELPPKPSFDPIRTMQTTARDFPTPPRPPEDSPRLCIIDSGIVSNHPLLANNVGYEEAILTHDPSPADANGHGTMVAGLAVFGDVRACYEAGVFSSLITLFSARVLNDRNEFDDEKLVINQIRQAVEAFYQPPHNCRVYNLSLGSHLPAIDSSNKRQTLWAEELDILARELKVVFIVSAGNHDEARCLNPVDAEMALQSYPKLLFSENGSTSICDPATSALSLTVGALAQHDRPAQVRGSGANDIVRPLAAMQEPSPVTRIGPGINGAIKPELVHYGGNLVFRGFAGQRKVEYEWGTAVLSFSNDPTRRLFSCNIGTSLAAPQISRIAALAEHRLRSTLEMEPTPNLIRALLACAAEIPPEAIVRLRDSVNENAPMRACGYGLPDEVNVLTSNARRVTMVYQGSISIDHFDLFAVPIPDVFRQAHGTRTIIVSLAYDPPVRRRRLDYLGVEMDMILIRGMQSGVIYDAFRKLQPNEEPESAIKSPYRIPLEPKANPRNSPCRRKKSTLQRCEFSMKRPERSSMDYGNEYFLVVRCERKWAPDDITAQDFALAVTLLADDPNLYNQVALRIRQREQARIMAH